MEKPTTRMLDKNSPYLQYDKGYNHAIGEYEGYHVWDIYTNYIHKDRLSVERILRILIDNTPLQPELLEKLATELSNQLKR